MSRPALTASGPQRRAPSPSRRFAPLLAIWLAVFAAQARGQDLVTVLFLPGAWVPDGQDARWLGAGEEANDGLDANAHYIRGPAAGADRAAWLAAARQLREKARSGQAPAVVRVNYRGVRAWTRMRGDLGRRLAFAPGERIRVRLEVRWLSGNPEIGFALDHMDRRDDRWAGWSGVFTTVWIPTDRQWHTLSAEFVLPDFDVKSLWANLIVGQDATHNAGAGAWELRGMTVGLAASPDRRKEVREIERAAHTPPKPLDRSVYDRQDLAWSTRNFACYFAFLYDRSFYDPAAGYRTEAFLDDLDLRFGGVDSVVLWHAYPRIGVDPRNQFDFYREVPGGLQGLKDAVDRMHRRGVKAFIDYNPWDTGTRREGVSDDRALADIVRAIGADGVFLDTMTEAPPALRATIDAARKGVVFEPEGTPPLGQLSVCSASWAQSFTAFSEPGLLRLKWIEPRHMQHQIRRWDRSHRDEIEAAFFNGSGMLIWENVFGSRNPWSDENAATWRRAVLILRAFADELASESWDPFVPTLVAGVYANRWTGPHGSITLLVNRTGRVLTEPVLQPPAPREGMRAFDLWHGREIAFRDGGAPTRLGRVGAIATAWDAEGLERLRPLLAPKPAPPASGPTTAAARLQRLRPIERTRAADPSAPPPGMLLVPRGSVRMRIRHERRECGCYADPGTPPERLDYFLFGTPFDEIVAHEYGPVPVGPFLIDECPVTNESYEAFLKATGYRPREPRNFLRHWPDGRCPEELRDHPVVCVDIDDARAYAKWVGKRLPTEEEWQFAAQGTDGRRWPWGAEFDVSRCNGSGNGTTPVRTFPQGRSPCGCYDMAGNVWQWTESERDDGHTRYAIIRGGSWFDAKGSLWYVRGGPQPLDHHAKFILLYAGMDRCATVGFRCVRDVSAE